MSGNGQTGESHMSRCPGGGALLSGYRVRAGRLWSPEPGRAGFTAQCHFKVWVRSGGIPVRRRSFVAGRPLGWPNPGVGSGGLNRRWTPAPSP
jgi:hypothetical protein